MLYVVSFGTFVLFWTIMVYTVMVHTFNQPISRCQLGVGDLESDRFQFPSRQVVLSYATRCHIRAAAACHLPSLEGGHETPTAIGATRPRVYPSIFHVRGFTIIPTAKMLHDLERTHAVRVTFSVTALAIQTTYHVGDTFKMVIRLIRR